MTERTGSGRAWFSAGGEGRRPVRPASTASEEKSPAVAPHADDFSVLSPVAEFFGNGQRRRPTRLWPAFVLSGIGK
jgi:hypothetical protein